MKISTLLNAAVLGASLMFISPVFAQSSAEISKMDLDKDGKVTRVEFMSTMITVFDKHAGSKGYCTAEEAKLVKRDLDTMYLN